MDGVNQALVNLQRLEKHKRRPAPQTPHLGQEMLGIYKSIEKHRTRMGKVGTEWERLVPPMLSEHCRLDSYVRGTLTVLVDSSPHLYELKQLLLAGLEKQLKLACKASALRKVVLKPGQWSADAPDTRKRPVEE